LTDFSETKKMGIDMTTGVPWKQIAIFSIPLLIGNAFQQLYNVVDSIIVGRIVGTEALAAVGTAFPVLFLMIALFIGISMGSSVMISQYFGAQDEEKLRYTVSTTYILIFFVSIAMTLIGIFSSAALLRLMNTPEEVMPYATAYLRILFLGTLPNFGYNAISGILRGVGNSKTPLYLLIVATVINIILDLLFVAGFHWGVTGAAWATIIAQTISFCLGAVYLNFTKSPLKINFGHLVFDKAILRNILKLGIPTGIQQTALSLGMMAIQSLVNGYGTAVIAGFNGASKVDSFAIMVILNFGIATSTFVGQNIGANRMDRVYDCTKSTALMASLVSVVIALVLVLLRHPVMSLFDDNMAVMEAGAQYLIYTAPFYFLFAIMQVYVGVMRGAGEAIVPLIITLLTLWVVRIPIAMFLSHQMASPAGIWLSTPAGWLIGVLFAYLYYRFGRWQNKALTFSPAK